MYVVRKEVRKRPRPLFTLHIDPGVQVCHPPTHGSEQFKKCRYSNDPANKSLHTTHPETDRVVHYSSLCLYCLSVLSVLLYVSVLAVLVSVQSTVSPLCSAVLSVLLCLLRSVLFRS